MTPDDVATIGFALAFIGYTVLFAVLLRAWRRGQRSVSFVIAAVVTAIWAGVALAGLTITSVVWPCLPALEGLRNAAWLNLGRVTLSNLRGDGGAVERRSDLISIGVYGVAVTSVGLFLADVLFDVDGVIQLYLVNALVSALVGLVLLENLVALIPSDRFWSYKHLLFAIGGLFTFELFRASEALLLAQLTIATAIASPFVVAMLIPFVGVAAVRLPHAGLDLAVSRVVVLQTSALVVSGCYLLGVAALGFLVQWLDADWSTSLQVILFFGAVLSLAVLVTSGALRTRIRRYIERNFFRFAYDYRQEWLRFSARMDGSDGHRLTSHQRAIAAAAEPLDCRGGLLFLLERNQQPGFAAAWNWRDASHVPPPPSSLTDDVTAQDAARSLHRDEGEWGEEARHWLERLKEAHLLLGLFSHGRPMGYIVLGKPFGRQRLTWEDHDLLTILGSQIGSYLALEQSTRALAEAQQFERLSKNVSFVGHDLKNIVTQLSLIVQQAEKHRGNEAFLADALQTVRESVDKMQAMLVRLKNPEAAEAIETVDTAALVRDFAKRKRGACRELRVDIATADLRARANPTGLAAILENLFANAREAAGAEGSIALRVDRDQGGIVVELEDDGPGMSETFIRDSLFRPFTSTKRTGYGLGMYQCRDMAERWGGRLDVSSTEYQGTTVRLHLAAVAEPETQAA